MPDPIDPTARYLASVLYSVQFARDPEVRLKQAAFERAFGSLFSGKQSINTNAPDAAAAAQPRFVYSSGHVQLTLSQVSLQLTMNFERTGPEFAERIRIARRKIEDLERYAAAFLENRPLRDSGIVITVDYPTTAPLTSVADHLYRRFFSFSPLGSVANTTFSLGFLSTRSFYENIHASIYELRQGPLAARALRPTVLQLNLLDIDALPAFEFGLEYKVDVNDKPRFPATGPAGEREPELLWRTALDLADTRASEILGLA